MKSHLYLILVLSLLLTFPGAALAADLHVAIHGDDSNDGSASHPFQSLERAKVEIRTRIKQGLQSDQKVWLHQGTYELQEPLVFDHRDSGTEQFSVQYVCVPKERVVVSGGRRIKNWDVAENGNWVANLPEVKRGGWFFRQLTVDDRRAIRARWPNEDGELKIENVSADVKAIGFDRPLPVGMANGQSTELVVLQNWSIARGIVNEFGVKQLSVNTPMGWIGHGPATTASPGKPAFLEHSACFLDKGGEWFLEQSTGNLQYISHGSEDHATSVVVAPRLEKLIVVAGTRDLPVRNLHFRGIQFEHTQFPLPPIGYNEIQASHFGSTMQAQTFVQPVAIECTHAHHCSFERCRFAHFNNSAIGFGAGCRMNSLSGCTIEEIGGTGVMIGWRGKGELEPGEDRSLAADWADPSDVPTGNSVSNCLVRRCGLDSFGSPGIYVAFSRGSRIRHNQVHDLPYTGISVGFRWNTSPTSQASCTVESNHVFDVMNKLADGAGIYTLGYQRGTILRGNYIHDVRRSSYAHGGAPNNGFFIDQGSKGFLFEANVVHSTSGESVRFNNSQEDWHQWNDNYFGNAAATAKEAKAIVEKAGIEPAWMPTGQ